MFFDPAYQSLKNGLVGYWSPVATGPTGLQLLDLSGQNNHGTLNGMDAPTDWVDSPYGKVLDFDNAYDYINIGDTKLTLLQCTIAGWFNFRSKNGYDGIINSRVGGSSTGLILEANGVRAAYNWNGLYYNYQGGPIIPLNRWVFIGVIISATQGQVFQVDNDVFSSGINVAPHTSASLSNLRLGHDSYDPNARYFDGQMAGAAIWNRELSQSEVQTLYNLGPGKLLRRNPNVAIAKRKWWPGVKTPKSRPIIPTQLGIKSGPIFYDPKASWFRNGLVGHWCPNLTGPTGTQLLDLSGQNNNGTLTNMDAPTDWVQSEKGLVLDFDKQNDEVLITDSPALNPTAQITVGLWYNSRSLPPSTSFLYCLLSKTSSVNAQPYPAWDIRGSSTSTIEAALAVGASSRTVSLGTINTNEWTFVSFTYNGSNIVGYRNGLQVASSAQTGAIGTTTNPISIGNNYGFSPRFFDGRIAEFTMWNRALTASEIQQLYQRGPGGFAARKPYRRSSYSPATKKIFKSRIDRKRSVSLVHPDQDNQWVTNGLVGFWCPSLTGATGTQLLDLSGQNNNGVLTGMDAPTDWVDSSYGTVLDFDGSNDYVLTNTPSSNVLPLGFSARTLSCWFLHNSGNTSAEFFGYGGNSSNGGRFALYTDTGNVIGVEINGSGVTIPYTRTASWRFLTATLNGQSNSLSNIAIYLDGLLGSATVSGANTINTLNTGVTIGTISGATTFYLFSGRIAGCSIWNRALNPSEIQTLYQLGPRMGFSRSPSRSPTWMVEADETIGNRRRRIICGGKN